MNIASIVQSIALLPELARSTIDYALWSHAILKARINGTDPDLEGDGCNDPTHDHSKELQPLPVWEAGRRALEFVMLLRAHESLGESFDGMMEDAANDIDSPQHAMDVIVALANMVVASSDDEAINMFSKFFLEAEAGTL